VVRLHATRTASESTARITGESSASARQIENEASIDSEVTPGDTEDVMANQRAYIQELVEKQAAMQARLEAMESRQLPANVLPVAVRESGIPLINEFSSLKLY
jgi:hypothetical protein